MSDLPALVTTFVTLFVVIDPVGLAPIFLAMTKGMTAQHRREIAVRSCLIALVILALFGIFGEAVLGFAGISMAAFRIAGGILLFLTALDMLFERRNERRQSHAESQPDPSEPQTDPSVFPLATPLIAGPGAIASMILITGRAAGPLEVALVHLVMAVVVALVFVFFRLSGYLERLLRETGIVVVTRLLGMLLAALSIQFVLDGLADVGALTPPR